jgi:C4-dicarboxylate-specific signal transduction histidine kinase
MQAPSTPSASRCVHERGAAGAQRGLQGDRDAARRAAAESLRAAYQRVLASGAHQERIIEALLTLTGHAGPTVTNTGAVVPASAVDRPLQPFQRLGTERTGSSEGLGLGLSIVQAIAEARGATLTIRPQPGGGLHAEVSFPPPSTASTRAGAERPQPAEPSTLC